MILSKDKRKETMDLIKKMQEVLEETKSEEPKNFTDLIGRESLFEKTFSRATFYVHNDFIKRIDKLCKGNLESLK